MCSKSFIKFRVSKKATKGLTKSLSCFDVHCKKGIKWATWRFHQIFVSFLEKLNFFALKKDVVTHVNVAIGFLNTLVLLCTPLKLWIILCVIQTIPENMGIIFVYYYYYYRNRMRTFAWREKDKWIKTNIRKVFIICRKFLEIWNTLWNVLATFILQF